MRLGVLFDLERGDEEEEGVGSEIGSWQSGRRGGGGEEGEGEDLKV